MSLCQELDIVPESDIVLFCLASDLGSKSIGEFAKEPFVSGWAEIDPRCVVEVARCTGKRRPLTAASTRWPR
jgi:hypothetical protein